MALKPPDSQDVELAVEGKRVYLDDLETLAGILSRLGPLRVQVTQANGTVSIVEELEDLVGLEIDTVRMSSRLPNQSTLLGYLDVAIVELGGPWFNRAVIDKRHPEIVSAVTHCVGTFEPYRPPWWWRVAHPRSDAASRWVEIVTDRRAQARATAQARGHDMRVMLVGTALGAVLGAVLTLAAGLMIDAL